mgnify:CR=1 FL=1
MKNGADYIKPRKEAERMLAEHKIEYLPIDPRIIAKEEGLDVVFFEPTTESMKKISGFLDINKKKIFVNSENSVNRQTFTIAHELGHWLMHKDIIQKDPSRYLVFRTDQMGLPSLDPMESEANAFAANLLVPMRTLLRLSEKYTVEELSKIFLVSVAVISNRLNYG